jgi:hypothetical protein
MELVLSSCSLHYARAVLPVNSGLSGVSNIWAPSYTRPGIFFSFLLSFFPSFLLSFFLSLLPTMLKPRPWSRYAKELQRAMIPTRTQRSLQSLPRSYSPFQAQRQRCFHSNGIRHDQHLQGYKDADRFHGKSIDMVYS